MGPHSKAKRYSMRGGTREEFAAHLEKQFPSEKKAIAEWMKMIDVKEFISPFLDQWDIP